jgi:hypothetical protein
MDTRRLFLRTPKRPQIVRRFAGDKLSRKAQAADLSESAISSLSGLGLWLVRGESALGCFQHRHKGNGGGFRAHLAAKVTFAAVGRLQWFVGWKVGLVWQVCRVCRVCFAVLHKVLREIVHKDFWGISF